MKVLPIAVLHTIPEAESGLPFGIGVRRDIYLRQLWCGRTSPLLRTIWPTSAAISRECLSRSRVHPGQYQWPKSARYVGQRSNPLSSATIASRPLDSVLAERRENQKQTPVLPIRTG